MTNGDRRRTDRGCAIAILGSVAASVAIPTGLVAATDVRGTIATSEWNEAGNPYRAVGDLTVPKGAVLTIGPGVAVRFGEGISLAVQGRLVIAGTAEKTVAFLPATEGGDWDGVLIQGADASASIDHLDMSGSAPAKVGGTTYTGAFSIRSGAKVEVRNSRFHDFKDNVIDSTGRSELEIFDTLIENCEEAVHSADSFCLLERVHIRGVTGYSDCVDFDNDSTPRSVIRECLIEDNAEDDAIDFGYTNALVENCVVRGIRGGKALDVEGKSSPEFINCVVYDSKYGIVSKDSCTPIFRHCTVTQCEVGVWCFEKNAGRGGGLGSAEDSIVWGNQKQFDIDAKSSFAMTHSLIGGGYAGEGNLDADPRFVDSASNDFRLLPGSPAAGTAQDGEDMGALPVAWPPQVPFVRGDVNGDGAHDIGDAIFLLSYLFVFAGGEALTCEKAGDANDDANLEISDAVFLLSYIFAGGPAPDAPFPGCGMDGTAGDLGCAAFPPCE